MKKKMFRGWNSGGIWKPKNPHSLEYLKYLYTVLSKNSSVTEGNRGLLVEALRSISEILIWGDQNDSTVFDFFLEKNMLSFFLKIMRQKCGRFVCTQLLQTLNILFENIRHETSLYYLLSNNHVNSIITHRFDFSDEEILAYYISFLKTLSFKLNSNTIHFFFNEHTNDFPLYTEAIKFFNHSESMVRIAVRTLTLNVYRIDDESMLKFICDKTAAPYFSNLVWFICSHIMEIDICAQSEEASHQLCLDRLDDPLAEHLDHIHYVNDILCLRIESLNQVLSDQMLRKLLIPICLGSLVPNLHTGGPHVSFVIAMFILSQVFLIFNYDSLVNRLSDVLLYGDGSIFALSLSPQKSELSEGSSPVVTPTNVLVESYSDEEKMKMLQLQESNCPESDDFPRVSRPFYCTILNALDASVTDHATFYALCLLYAIGHNEGINEELLKSGGLNLRKKPEEARQYNDEIVNRLLSIIHLSTDPDSQVRLITLEIASIVFREMVGQSSHLSDQHLASLYAAREKIVSQLRHYYEQEEMFLDLFDDEYHRYKHRKWSINFVSADPALLIHPMSTPLSGVDFVMRLPSGGQERTRRGIGVYFLLHHLLLSLNNEAESKLPLTKDEDCVHIDDSLNLNNSDLLSCTIMHSDSKLKRFLVTDGLQLILVEPDSKLMGWGIVRFVGFLQDLEVNGDKDDSRALFVTVHQPSAKVMSSAKPLLAARFVFDDHIRCMAAKQRLTKGRQKARQYKMDLIADLLEIEKRAPTPPSKSFIRNSVRRSGKKLPGYASPATEAYAAQSTSHATVAPAGAQSSRHSSTVVVPELVIERKQSDAAANQPSGSDSPPIRHQRIAYVKNIVPGMEDSASIFVDGEKSGGLSGRRKVRVLSIGSIAKEAGADIPLEDLSGRGKSQDQSDKKPSDRVSVLFSSGTPSDQYTAECELILKRSQSLSPTYLRKTVAGDDSEENSPRHAPALPHRRTETAPCFDSPLEDESFDWQRSASSNSLVRRSATVDSGLRQASVEPSISLWAPSSPMTRSIRVLTPKQSNEENVAVDETAFEVKEDSLSVGGGSSLQCFARPRRKPVVQDL